MPQLFLAPIDDDELARFSSADYINALDHAYRTGLQDGEAHLLDPVQKEGQPLAKDLCTAYARGFREGELRRASRRGARRAA